MVMESRQSAQCWGARWLMKGKQQVSSRRQVSSRLQVTRRRQASSLRRREWDQLRQDLGRLGRALSLRRQESLLPLPSHHPSLRLRLLVPPVSLERA